MAKLVIQYEHAVVMFTSFMMAATMAHSECRGVDPVDMESEVIDPPYCPHGKWSGF